MFIILKRTINSIVFDLYNIKKDPAYSVFTTQIQNYLLKYLILIDNKENATKYLHWTDREFTQGYFWRAKKICENQQQ